MKNGKRVNLLMRKFIFIPLLVFAIIGYTFYSCKQHVNAAPGKEIAKTLLAQVDSFAMVKNKLLTAVQSGAANEKQVSGLFLQLRLAYKKFEWAAEYFNPAVARFVNGPPVQEVEMTSGQVFEPAGLQVIEGLLFPKYNSGNKTE